MLISFNVVRMSDSSTTPGMRKPKGEYFSCVYASSGGKRKTCSDSYSIDFGAAAGMDTANI